MPKYRVTKCVDAYAHFTTVVEAESPGEAIAFAQDHEDELSWEDDGFIIYDNADWSNIEPEEVIDE